MNAFIDAAIQRSRTTLLVLFMVIIAGLLARTAIPIANEPDIEVPFFVVSVYHEGISPARYWICKPWRTIDGLRSCL